MSDDTRRTSSRQEAFRAAVTDRAFEGLFDLTERVGRWHRQNWGSPNEVTMACKLSEEVGEVAEAAVKVAQDHPRADEMDYGGELADVVIVAMAAAHLADVNLAERVARKMAGIGAYSPGITAVLAAANARHQPTGADDA